MSRSMVYALLVASFIVSAAAESGLVVEKVLVPIFFEGQIEGNRESLWKSVLSVSNRSETAIRVGGIEGAGCSLGIPCDPVEGELPTIGAGITLYPKPSSPVVFPPASFLVVEEGRYSDLGFSLRIQDVSRQALTWGTTIPVVPESQAFTGPADMQDVPVDGRFRVLLRIYDFAPGPAHRVRISGYRIDPRFDSPIYNQYQDFFEKVFEAERDLVPYGEGVIDGEDGPYAVPGYTQMDLSEVDVPEYVSNLRIRVEPVGEGLSYWAFVSVTNNETQHVTTILPY